MARVVQRKKNPLILVTSVFALLFLISAALAVIFYNQADQAVRDKAKADRQRNQLANDQDLNIDEIQALLKEAGTRRPGKPQPTVINQVYTRLQDLAFKVTGQQGLSNEQVDAAIADARKAMEAAMNKPSNLPLLSELKNASDQIKALKANIADLNKETERLLAKEAATTKLTQESIQKLKVEINALNSQKLRAIQASDQAKREQIKKLADVDRQYKKKLDDQKREIDRLLARISELDDMIVPKLKARIAQLEKELRGPGTGPGDTYATRPAGNISKTMTSHPICFIPLGANDRVVRGMTFRVYGPEGIPEDGEDFKAAITVTRVGDNISQCRISPKKDAPPVAVGDLFANIAYDPTHQLNFVVEGDFDLYGTGQATEFGKRQVLDVITRSGGKVSKDLTVQTDYLVVGSEPVIQDKPEEDAPEAARMAYKESVDANKRYQDLMTRAKTLNIQILNLKRFLILTGFDPKQTLD